MTLHTCRDCGELAAMDPAFQGRCSWCHYLATHPDWTPPWWRSEPAVAVDLWLTSVALARA